MADTFSANCPHESGLQIRLRSDFPVVFGGYAGEGVNRHIPLAPTSHVELADRLEAYTSGTTRVSYDGKSVD